MATREEKLRAIADMFDAFGRLDADGFAGHLTEDSFDTDVAHLHTMRGDQVAELRTWLDHAEGLRQLASPEEVPFPV
jgi:ketosteroid isomerase-like protein